MALIHTALADLKAEQVVDLDLRRAQTFADALVVGSGTSTRHVTSLGEKVAQALGPRLLGSEGLQAKGEDGGWVCLDAGAVVIHIFTPEKRALYNLEKLWSYPF